MKLALNARTDNLGAPPVRGKIIHEVPEVSPLATVDPRLQRGLTMPIQRFQLWLTFDPRLQRMVETEE